MSDISIIIPSYNRLTAANLSVLSLLAVCRKPGCVRHPGDRLQHRPNFSATWQTGPSLSPLMVQEAQAYGANLGRIAEPVRDGMDGWLLPFDDPRPWTDAIVEAVTNCDTLARLSSNRQRMRTVEDVALDIVTLDRDVMAGRTLVR